MKHFFLLAGLLCASLSSFAAQLTFRVDMSGQTVAAAGVHVAGTFQAAAGYTGDWNPATTLLTDPDNDRIYELTVTVPAGTYLYKFVNGSAWAGAEIVPAACGLDDGGGNVNRQATVGTAGLRLPAVGFGGCLTELIFRVNMRGQTVSRAGVHVMGNFQTLAGYATNWDPISIALTDTNGDEIYEARVGMPATGRFQYKFVNGNTLAAAEVVPAACGVVDGTGNLNRVLDATATTTATLCFGTCTNCGPSLTTYTTHWWNDAVFYEVFVRSFYDTNADGQGDFAGLTAKLDYLNDGNPATTTDLGVTALWLMPMMDSPSYHGYDVTNYKATEPDYGTMAGFEAFLAAAHARGIKVIIDLVLNHSSSQHPWFQQAAGSTTSSYRDWYRWSATNPGAGWYLRNGSYYYGYFWSEMPDLNWRNPQMKAAMWDATRFWLKKGVDGYRLDAVKFLVEDGAVIENTPGTLDVLKEFRDSVRAVSPNAFTVGEAWTNTEAVVPYVLDGGLDACFEFDLATTMIGSLTTGNAAGLRTQLTLIDSNYPRLQYATFLTNHDQNRIMSQLGGNMARMKQAAALYLTMPGVPFLYYGEEVGMLGTGADEEKRKPMQWTAGPNAGFSTGTPWRAPNSNYAQFNVATMQADPASLLNHYKKLIGMRTAQPVLRKGYMLPVSTPGASVLSYARVFGAEAAVVVANLGSGSAGAPALSLAVSSLPAGVYQATDLYSGQVAGQVTLDGQGGFSGWIPALGALGANQTWVLHLTPASPTAVRPANQLAFSFYPNPATTQVQLELPEAGATPAQLTVYDLTGRLLHTRTFTGRRHTLDTSGWANGTYFLRIQAGNASSVQRLVVAH
ncbi:Por secretion system C-terminal sorting domain-containing protein [Hymenobacter daecheongensis DSM 21074]|uniref:Por secretion system C-terminal sorting domain-containing protein n=1 Tax=Hymenobacter daecheongensis DSM 21074 TaxID=1121955 RepID=A0A1M6HYK3_9BACT|nr:alpha-amylase family glycosyl hydrolase [Hymenobacter daecheongensis]SHJ27154.1 Por secretion system C-terminal sorting domain-containing protein [Hymenobacter daecheongensis DSM 21074]